MSDADDYTSGASGADDDEYGSDTQVANGSAASEQADKVPISDVSEGSSDEEEAPEPSRGRSQSSFGGLLSSLLQQDAPGAKAPILSASKRKTETPEDAAVDLIGVDAEVAEARRLKRAKQEKRALKEKEHVHPQFDHNEKRLLRIATKGVVTLFNALSKQHIDTAKLQKESEAKGSKLKKDKVAELAEKGFMAKLSGDAAVAPGTVPSVASTSKPSKAKAAPAAEPVKPRLPTFTSSEGTWSVLKDDYMMGANMKDWDKSADEASDGEE